MITSARSYESSHASSKMMRDGYSALGSLAAVTEETEPWQNYDVCLAVGNWRNPGGTNHIANSGGAKHNALTNGCTYCGWPMHPRKSCPARNSVCAKCSSPGHWARMCRKSKTSGGPAKGTSP